MVSHTVSGLRAGIEVWGVIYLAFIGKTRWVSVFEQHGRVP